MPSQRLTARGVLTSSRDDANRPAADSMSLRRVMIVSRLGIFRETGAKQLVVVRSRLRVAPSEFTEPRSRSGAERGCHVICAGTDWWPGV